MVEATRVCQECGLSVALAASGRWVHTDTPPERWEPHDADPVTVAVYRPPDEDMAPTPGERQAAALERIAAALERLAEAVHG